MKEIDKLLYKFKKITNAKTDKELCEILDIRYSTLDTWKNNNKIPEKRLFEITEKIKSNYNNDEDLNSSINNFQESKNKIRNGSLINNSTNFNTLNENNCLIPEGIIIELNSLFERLKDKDEDFIKNITYKIEDFISEIKKETRD